MRKKIIAANWKMNMTVAETQTFLEAFRLEVEEVSAVEIVIAPPFTALPKLSELLGGSQKIRLGAQNFYFERSGAYTGEVSASMLRELFVKYVIVGHSERRQIFGETDALINKKVLAAHASELKPILCVGETLVEREAGSEKEVLETQLRGGLAGVSPEQLLETVIAYEPVWAIGTGEVATPEDAQEVCAAIRERLEETFSAAVADDVRILYGGSVKMASAGGIMAQPDVDGCLVGGASLKVDEFAGICRYLDLQLGYSS
jgi:triosephosphate isomerase (TIM)